MPLIMTDGIDAICPALPCHAAAAAAAALPRPDRLMLIQPGQRSNTTNNEPNRSERPEGLPEVRRLLYYSLHSAAGCIADVARLYNPITNSFAW